MKTINRLSKNDTLKATAYDTEGNFASSFYDSGYSCIYDVISELDRRSQKEIKEVQISNESKCWCDRYTKSGRKL